MTALPDPSAAGPDACTTIGSVVTCQGDQSDGIASGLDFSTLVADTLNIFKLSQAIEPVPGIDGINFFSPGPITIDSNMAGFGIFTRGGNVSGISASSDTGAVTILQTGDVTTRSNDSTGIVARSDNGPVSVTQTGNIQTYGFDASGISASSKNRSVSITQTGDITTLGLGLDRDPDTKVGAIVAYSQYGSVMVKQTGNITARIEDGERILGLREDPSSGFFDVDVTRADGIVAQSDRGESVRVRQTGDITVLGTGIRVRALVEEYRNVDGDSSVTVTQTGDIIAGWSGIVVSSDVSNTKLTQTGDITGASGIRVFADEGSTTVTQTGDIKATFGPGISVSTEDEGSAIITQIGDIVANGDGIRADGGSVSIVQTGDIMGIRGIYASSNDGDVSVTQTGNITGNYAGIYADGNNSVTVIQNGNITTTLPLEDDSSSRADGIGVYAGSSFHGGSAIVKQTGDISTQGETAHAIRVELDSRSDVADVTQSGNITTQGEGAHGIDVDARGTSAVNITKAGNLMANGLDANGIQGASEDGNISIRVGPGGKVQGGGGTGAGVRFGDNFGPGAENSLTNRGTIWALSGLAILGDTGNETINNHGTVTGDVKLGGGKNRFSNLSGAMFNSGATVSIGAGNSLVQSGTINPGGEGVIQTTSLGSNLSQTIGGTFQVDVDPATGKSDRIDVSGTASFNGTVSPNLLTLPMTKQTFVITSGANADLANGAKAADALLVDYQLLFPANEMQLSVALDFDVASKGATPNQQAVAGALEAILKGGAASNELLRAVTLIADLPGDETGLAILDQLHPEPFDALMQTTFSSALGFNDALMSCRVAGAAQLANDEGTCAWGAVAARGLDYDQSNTSIGFNEFAVGAKGGYQFATSEKIRVGFALGYEHSDIDIDTGASSDGHRIEGGLVVKYLPDPFKFAASVSGGYAWHDTNRRIALLGVAPVVASSDQEFGFVAGHLRISSILGNENFYIKPQIDGGITYLHMDGFSETGAGALGLNVQSVDNTYGTISPSLEIGGHHEFGNGEQLRPYARAGLVHVIGDNASYKASFQGAPVGLGTFVVTGNMDDMFATFGAGFDLFSASGASFTVHYDGQISFDGNTTQHAGGLKATVPF